MLLSACLLVQRRFQILNFILLWMGGAGLQTATHWDNWPGCYEWPLHRLQPRRHPRHRYIFDRWLWHWQRLDLGHRGELRWFFEKFALVDNHTMVICLSPMKASLIYTSSRLPSSMASSEGATHSAWLEEASSTIGGVWERWRWSRWRGRTRGGIWRPWCAWHRFHLSAPVPLATTEDGGGSRARSCGGWSCCRNSILKMQQFLLYFFRIDLDNRFENSSCFLLDYIGHDES
jgi:hypothetical protein